MRWKGKDNLRINIPRNQLEALKWHNTMARYCLFSLIKSFSKFRSYFYIQYCIYRALLKLTWFWDCLLVCVTPPVLAPFGGGAGYGNESARRSGKRQWGGSLSKLWLSRMDIIFVLLGWCRYHNGSSVPLKRRLDNGLASHAFREGASSFTETLSWPQTLFPLAALIPCPVKLSSRDTVVVSFDGFHSGFWNCFKSTWGHKSPYLS